MVDNIVINTIVPAVFAYGLCEKEEKFKDSAILWLKDLQFEENSITKQFVDLELPNRTAFDSQAFIKLKTQYYDHTEVSVMRRWKFNFKIYLTGRHFP
jgi:hypothetical protein